MGRVGVITEKNAESIREVSRANNLTPGELADLLGITKTSVYPLITKWEIPVTRGNFREERFHSEDWDLPPVPVPDYFPKDIDAGPWVSLMDAPEFEQHPAIRPLKEAPLSFLLYAEYVSGKYPRWDRGPAFRDGNSSNLEISNLVSPGRKRRVLRPESIAAMREKAGVKK